MFSKKYKYPSRLLFQKRAFHAYCVGTPKSGTHSIAEMLSNYRASHEPNEILIINMIHDRLHNKLSNDKLNRILRARDVFHWYEMESSHLMGMFAPELSLLFNNAKFILTIRDCISWLDSWFNHQLSRPPLNNDSIYNLGRNNYYSQGYSYTRYDRFLEGYNLFPIKSYLAFWTRHNSIVLNSIPGDKLLVIKTNEISSSSDKISKFLMIPKKSINIKYSHAYKAKEKYKILRQIDINYLYDTAMEVCGDLNNKYFPENTIEKSLADYKV
ncbi:MAG: sulfotransferase [Candidatus Nitrosoglobus sp.]